MRRQLSFHVATIWFCLLAATMTTISAQQDTPKWSRQVDGVDSGESDALDWVPLAQPLDGSTKDRSANGRVLTYSQSFPPNARFGDLPKASHQQQFEYPFQFQRFGNGPQAQPLRQGSSLGSSLKTSEPTSQSFFKFEMPFRNEGLRGGGAVNVPPTLQTGYQIQHSFNNAGGAQSSVFNSPLYGQQPVFPPEYHPVPQKPIPQSLTQPQKSLHQQNFIDDILPLKTSVFKESKPLPTQQSLQSVTPQVFPVDPQPEALYNLNKPSTFQSAYQQSAPAPASSPSAPTGPSGTRQQQDVQLLYVPYDTLYNQQQSQGVNVPSSSNSNYDFSKYNLNAGLPAVNPYQINQFYTQDPLGVNDFYTASTTPRPRTTTPNALQAFQNFGSQQFTTMKPKPKAHQPPLAMFLLRTSARPSQSDVVSALASAHAISVIDAPTKRTPDIFVGPAGMPIPNGYVKFDLPYLSMLAHSHDLRDVPFFVAPLSYRTPSGFNKILLPEPHVGSIVINRSKDLGASNQQEIGSYQTTTQRTRPSAQRVKEPVPTNDFYAGTTTSTRNPFEIPTQRPTQEPQRGNKFSYYYVQDAIQEVTSPKVTKQERHKKKRPQTVQNEHPTYQTQTNSPFDQFNQIGNDDFFAKVQPHRPTTSTSTSTSTSTTSTTTSTTSTTAAPPTLFTYGTSPQVNYQSSNGQLYHGFNAEPEAPIQEYVPRFTTRTPPATATEEEFRMKQYFRQQDAFRNRPHIVNPTNAPFEQVQYTPVTVDYEREVSLPSSTQKSTSKSKQRIPIYTPATVPITTSDVGYNSLPQRDNTEDLPLNHRPSYNQNEIPDGNAEYDINPYHVPSELPPLTPDIPGLVNNLQEKDKLLTTTTPAYEPEPPTRPTRRPIHRTRKPLVSKVTSSVSYSESESTNKQNANRVRRPFGTRANAVVSSADTEATVTTTKRPAVTRNPLLRNPNRIRYRPTHEERQSLKIKPKKPHHSSSSSSSGSKKEKEAEDLDYQRDVLKQNYPVFSQTGRKPTSPTAIPSSYDVSATEGPTTSEAQQVYTVTPSNSIDSHVQGFPSSLLEPMQIAQHYNEFSKDNYGPGYFPNQEDVNPTEPILRNEVNPIYTTVASTTPPTTSTATSTTTTTTTEEPITTTTRRSPFIRRNYPRLRTTTTTEPPTTTSYNEERPSTRARIPPRRVIKVRTRSRRPQHPASSTAEPQEDIEQVTQKQNLRKYSRYQQDQQENETPPRRRYKPQFKLEGQESQWSPAIKTSNANSENFKPLKETPKTNEHSYENEPEIVTAGPLDEKAQTPETYEFNVAANLGSADNKATLMAPNLKPEKSFAELLEEVMGKAPEDFTTSAPTESPRTTDYFESQKTTIAARLNRRGKWKKTRVAAANGQHHESFEAAESQNIGSQLYNALHTASEKANSELKPTTPMTPTPTTNAPAMMPVTTTAIPQIDMEEYEMTTSRSVDYTTLPMNPAEDAVTGNDATEESATRRMDTAQDVADDLEVQPSLFSEVKKQLHDLFAIEENEDQTVTAALAAVGKRNRQEYTSIKRTKANTEISTTTPSTPTNVAPTTVATTAAPVDAVEAGKQEKNKDSFHKDLMDHVVYATSTSTKVTSETEICYRGRCIKSEDLPANHKLH